MAGVPLPVPLFTSRPEFRAALRLTGAVVAVRVGSIPVATWPWQHLIGISPSSLPVPHASTTVAINAAAWRSTPPCTFLYSCLFFQFRSRRRVPAHGSSSARRPFPSVGRNVP